MKTINRIGCFTTLAGILAITSCSMGGKSPSGFLSNYKDLDSGHGTSDAVTSYVKPGTDFKKYDSVIIEPVTTIVSTSGISQAVTEEVAAYLEDSLREQIDGSLKITSTPGPSTLKIRTALTDVIEGQGANKAVTVVHSDAKATMSGKLGSPEIAAWVSHVSFEGEILDSQSNDRLAALIDHRLGVKREATASTSWAAVRSGINMGVTRLRERFFTLRAN